MIRSKAKLIWLGLYICALVVLALALSQARRQAMVQLETDEAQADWQDWRTEASRQAEGEGPVARRIPRSEQHPELVMLRDHFAVSFIGLALLTTALFITAAFMVGGVLGGRRFQVVDDGTVKS